MGIWVYFVAIMNNADVTIRAHMCEHKFSFRLGIYIPKNGIAGSYGNSCV